MPTRHAARLFAPLVTAASLFWSSGAHAAETLFADSFDSSVFGYISTVSNVTVTWSPEDVDDVVDSGSALLVNSRSDGSSGPVNWVLDCFAVAAGTAYPAGASILIPSGQNTSGVAQVFVSWYANASCTAGSFLGFDRTFEIRNAGSWQRSEEPLTAPAGALGARVGITLFKNEPVGSLEAHFDNLLFMPEAGEGASACAALLALIVCRRIRVSTKQRAIGRRPSGRPPPEPTFALGT